MDTKKKFPNNLKSAHFRISNRTYFFDVNIGNGDKKYLKITKSMFLGEGNPRKYNSVVIYPEDLVDFQKNLKDMVGYLS